MRPQVNLVPPKSNPSTNGAAMKETEVRQERQGLSIIHYFTTKDKYPYDRLDWERRTASITGEGGKEIFKQEGVRFPKDWSQLATNIVSSKYFRGQLGAADREYSVEQLIDRVADTITRWGEDDGYFEKGDESHAFCYELKHILVNQMATFNSPVWFNIGVKDTRQQASACFIISVEDNMHSILDWYRQEGVIFQGGSGSGVNLSRIRALGEPLSGGGTASGPLSFMRAADASAGAIKSGGTTRRSAKMVVLNADHPDVLDFIRCKVHEEKKAHALVDAGYDSSLDGEAYATVSFQNANNSVRVSDTFMRAVQNDEEWKLRGRKAGFGSTVKARELMHAIAQATWECGDPGMQFDDTINNWHTCPEAGRQEATNPCSEYCWINDSACNLASLNLLKFLDNDGDFNVQAFKQVVHIMIIAQEILVGRANYPTEAIEKNSHDYRTLGLGYANLGALLMSCGLPYDSDQGRSVAAAITSLMTGQAYLTSSIIAGRMGPFAGYEATNVDAMMEVMKKHKRYAHSNLELVGDNLREAAKGVWANAIANGHDYGYRNAQVTLLAPTGTIAFMMDCDTTGVEPDLSLVKNKKLVGGGNLRIVNQSIAPALRHLGYQPSEIESILNYVNENGTIEGCPEFDGHLFLPIFDCAFPAKPGGRSIHYMGHLKMVAAVQPFLSGAVSKTINVPNSATVEDIEDAYIEAWKSGVKCVAIYRDGCKRTQPLNTSASAKQESPQAQDAPLPQPARRRLPNERTAITHKFTVGGHKGYLTIGLYEDGSPGEMFLTMAKEGSTISGLMDTLATSVSISLQHGVPLKHLVEKFAHSRFEPSGFTGNPDIPMAKSITDYVFRWLGARFLSDEDKGSLGILTKAVIDKQEMVAVGAKFDNSEMRTQETFNDSPACAVCGALMTRNGTCYKCENCGMTSGCS